MEILIFSDSHGDISNITTVIKNHPTIEYIIHLGDYGTDISKVRELNPFLITDAIQGNADRIKELPLVKVLQLVDKKIMITHGHNYGVKFCMTSIVAEGLLKKYDVILYGHTHEPSIQKIDGILLVNPGSISKPRNNIKATYAILEVTSTKIDARILEVKIGGH